MSETKKMTWNKKLSPRAFALLLSICDSTEYEGNLETGRTLKRYWNPARADIRSNVWGAGDARILKMLENRGLTQNHRPHRIGFDYCYFITERGEQIIKAAVAAVVADARRRGLDPLRAATQDRSDHR